MKPFEALKQFFRPTDSTIALPGSPFIVIDREAAVRGLKLEERAKSNGSANYPHADAENFDDVEAEIIAEMAEHTNRAQMDALASYRVYGERLSELSLLRELSTITGASEQALGDFHATIIDRRGRLSLAKDEINESYGELARFKELHGLERPAHRAIGPVYAWSIVGIFWLVEAAFNTGFLRVNDDYGLLGGFIAACVVAAINILTSALVGRAFWPKLKHKDLKQKLTGLGVTAIWVVFLITWNLVAGHYRDAKAAGIPSPETAALGLFAHRLLLFDSLYSYGLLAAGLIFAAVSATVAFSEDDPYPGYGPIYRRHEERCEGYADAIKEALDELKEIRDQATSSAAAIRAQLGAQFRERGQILTARETHRIRYREHQEYLEEIGNFLLGSYRAENVRSRGDGLTPKHFNKRWQLRRTELPVDEAEPSIDGEVLRAQEMLEASIKRIADAYQEAIRSFEHLDKIKEGLARGENKFDR